MHRSSKTWPVAPLAAATRVPAVALLAVALLVGACQPVASAPPVSRQPSAPAASANGLATPGASAAGPVGGAAIPLVVDTDVAPDDVTAIASLLRDPAVDVLAITVSGTGEAHCPGGMFVIRAIVTMLREDDIPVSCGRASPFADAEPFPDPWRAGADAGSGLSLVSPRFVPDARPAADLLVALAAAEAAAGRTLTILTLGPLTNLAEALERDSGLPGKVRVVSMLGAVGVPGNVQGTDGPSSAEWNAHADPTAVRRVLEAGFDWTLIPLDATQSAPLTPELYAELRSDHAAGPADIVFELWSKNAWMYQGGSYLWDPLAAIAVRDPSTVTTRTARLRVIEGAAPNGGTLAEDGAGQPVSVAISADRGTFEAALLQKLRIGGPRANSFNPVATVAVRGDARRCEVVFDVSPPPAGQLQIDLTNTGTEPLNAIVFELNGVTWPVVESYVKAYNPAASPPPVSVLAQVSAAAHGGATAYAVSPAGTLGVACFTGAPEAPTIVLAGPFGIGA